MNIDIDIDEKLCKGCGLCIYFCPRAVIDFSTRRNEKGYVVVEIKDIENCTGCRLCEISCPDLAIAVIKEPICKDEPVQASLVDTTA